MGSITKHSEFVGDLKDLINNFHRLVDKNNQQAATDGIESFMVKWGKILNQPVKALSVEETRKQHCDKMTKLYEELQNSIITQKTVATELKVTSDDTAIEKNRILLAREKQERVKLLLTQYEIGFVLYTLNTSFCNNSKELFKTLLTGVLSVSHAYKLIRFYKVCEEYPCLKFSSLSFKSIYSNLDALTEFMRKDVSLWNPSTQ